MRKFYVYQLRLGNSETPFYIGKGFGRRSRQHLTPSSRKVKSHKNRVINKAMREGIEVLSEILFDGLTEPEAHAKEVELIAFYGRRINGGCLTNATDGGEGVSGYEHDAITKTRISKTKSGKINTKEHNNAISLAKIGKAMPRDAVERSASAHVGNKHSPAAIAKMSAAKIGKTHSPEHRKSVKYGHWDRNPAWKKADFLHGIWEANGRPTLVNFRKLTGEFIDNIHRKFREGWIPKEDPVWKSYAVT